MANTPINPDALFKMAGFHQIVTSSGNTTIHIAGQVAFDKDMQLVGEGDYTAQTMRVFQNIAIAAEAAGASPNDVVSSNLYIKGLNPDVSAAVMQGMAKSLDGKPFPAHAFNMIGVESLSDPRVLIEVSAVAVVE